MNQKEQEIYDYFEKKMIELQEEDKILIKEAKKLKDEYAIISNKLNKNNDLFKEYLEIQTKLRKS
jgi:uncharacterized protein YabE (DUF348 family)